VGRAVDGMLGVVVQFLLGLLWEYRHLILEVFLLGGLWLLLRKETNRLQVVIS
jgi:hypothetical protein